MTQQMKTRSSRAAQKPEVPRNPRPNGSTPVVLIAAIGLTLLSSARAASAATITVDASKQTAGNPHFWSAAFGTGKAKLALRGDWQTHYKIGNRELGALRVRGHGLLNDEMGLWKGTGSYDWKNLDTYLTAITSANMRPIMELDFMPTGLASSGDKSPPKDYNEWKNFIKALTQHCIDKYNADDVGKWYWEVWNEPDYSGFWKNTDMNAYYTLYDNTVDALTAVIPNVLVGGPATTQAGPVKAFLQHCKSAGKRVTFASSHNYPGGSATGTNADAASLVNDNNSRISGITGAGYNTSDVKSFNTEWNSSYSGQGGNVGDATNSMDNHWNVGFILKGVKLLSDKNSGDTPPLEVFSYWALSDVFDEDGGTDGVHMSQTPNTPFGQVFGLITYQGMRKAAFNAFKLLNYLGPDRLQSGGGTGSDGIDAMATKSTAGDSVEILVYNYYAKLNTASGSGDSVTVNVSNLPSALANKEIFVTRFLVDETHSNPYKVWSDLGKSSNPSTTDWEKMRSAQHLAVMESDKKTVDTSFSTTFTLTKQAGTLLILSAKRPLTGRNALVEIEGEDYDGQSGATKKDSGDSTTLGQEVSINSGGYVYYENVDFTDGGVGSVDLRTKGSATVELRTDSQTGTSLGSCAVQGSSWTTTNCKLTQGASGVKKLYVVPSGALEINYLKFQTGQAPQGTGGSGAGGSTGAGAGGTTGSGSGGSTGTPGGGATGSGSGGSTGTARGGAGGSTGPGRGGSTGSGSGGATGSSNGGSTGSGNGGSTGSGNGGSTGFGNGGSTGSSPGEGGSTGSGSGNGGSTGGTSETGGAGGGGSGGSGGSGGNEGSGGSTPLAQESSSGCSCRIGNASRPSGTLLIIGLVAIAFGGLRRRRARHGR
jgi:xylan 1,4-beta-xylosidase